MTCAFKNFLLLVEPKVYTVGWGRYNRTRFAITGWFRQVISDVRSSQIEYFYYSVKGV